MNASFLQLYVWDFRESKRVSRSSRSTPYLLSVSIRTVFIWFSLVSCIVSMGDFHDESHIITCCSPRYRSFLSRFVSGTSDLIQNLTWFKCSQLFTIPNWNQQLSQRHMFVRFWSKSVFTIMVCSFYFIWMISGSVSSTWHFLNIVFWPQTLPYHWNDCGQIPGCDILNIIYLRKQKTAVQSFIIVSFIAQC